MKILLIRFSSFGDIILTFNLIIHLKKVFPKCVIDFIVKEKFSEILYLHKEIDNVITLNKKNFKEIRKNISNNSYNYIFDLQKNLKSYLLTIFLRPRTYRIKKENIKKILLVFFKINLFKNAVPVYKKYLSLISKIDRIKLDTNFQTAESDFEKGIRNLNEPYIVVAPSSKHFTKRYPTDKFIQLLKRNKKYKIVLIGDNNEIDLSICKIIEKNIDLSLNFCGKLSYKELINIISYSEFIICNDSGILHLSEALNKKVYVFFGSTVKEFGFYPQLKSTIVFENNEIDCRPCSKIGRKKCPQKHFKCMNEIKEDILF